MSAYRPHPVLWRALCMFNEIRAAGVPSECIYLSRDGADVVVAACTGVYGEGFICACGPVPAGWSDQDLTTAWTEAAGWWATTDIRPDPVEPETLLWIRIEAAKVRWPQGVC